MCDHNKCSCPFSDPEDCVSDDNNNNDDDDNGDSGSSRISPLTFCSLLLSIALLKSIMSWITTIMTVHFPPWCWTTCLSYANNKKPVIELENSKSHNWSSFSWTVKTKKKMKLSCTFLGLVLLAGLGKILSLNNRQYLSIKEINA